MFNGIIKLSLLLAITGVYHTNGAKILIVFNAISKSHHILGDALALGLAEKGHEVLMISPFKSSKNHSNYKEIILDGEFDADKIKQKLGNLFEAQNRSILKGISSMSGFGLDMAKGTLNHPKVIELLNSDAKFDAVIVEVFLNECLLGLAQFFDALPIMMGTAAPMIWTNKMVGNPSNPAYNIAPFLPLSHPMSYLDRLKNTGIYLISELFYWLNIRAQNSFYESYFRPMYKKELKQFPHLSELVTNVSLVLLNSNIAISEPQALVPNMINVGGLHIKPEKLPDDLQKILDDSKNGVIYFSMGSNLRSSELPQFQRDAILKTFSKMKETVLWKWEDEELPNKPKNVVIRKWMPQQSILNHTNVKVFITHGGLLSSIESIYFGVPLVGIPIFGDQHMNMARASRSGYGIKINFNEIDEETFTKVLLTVLNNPSYKVRSKYLSKIFRDESEDPLEKAVSGVEYILRHKGANFLRSPSTGIPLYQEWLLDVVSTFAIVLYIIIKVFKCLLNIIYNFCKCIFKSKNIRQKID